MAVPKFYRVLRGQRGDAAKAKLLAHFAGLSEIDITTPVKPRDPIQKLYIIPFNISLGSTVQIQCSAISTSYNQLKVAIGNKVREAIPGTDTSVKIRGISPARIAGTVGLLGTGTPKASKLTGLRYIDYGGTGVSAPFGKSTSAAAETQQDNYEGIVANLSASIKNYHLIPEKI